MKTLADFENLQKTTSRDIANAKEFAISKFAGELVNSVDVLELAIGAATKQKAAESDATADFNSLLEGVQMTHGNLEKTLSRHGVTKFDPKGEKFDPNKHEALFMVPAAATGPDGIKESGVVMDTQKTVRIHTFQQPRASSAYQACVLPLTGLDVQEPRASGSSSWRRPIEASRGHYLFILKTSTNASLFPHNFNFSLPKNQR